MLNVPLHHIGVATRGIEQELPCFAAMGYRPSSSFFVEPGQKVRGLFLSAPGQPCLELLEQVEDSGPLDSWLKKGIKFYHFCYAVPDIDRSLGTLLHVDRARVVVPVSDADFFTKICFVMLPNMLLIELVTCRPGAGDAANGNSHG